MHSSKKYHLLHGVNLPETIKASPLSNVVNVRKDRDIFTYDNRRGLERRRMSRLGSLCFLLRQLSDNFISRRAKFLPADEIPGSVSQLPKPDGLPVGAQWLGGVGEGAWYLLKTTDLPNQIEVARYTEEGILEYTVAFFSSTNFDKSKPYRIVHDSHMLYTTIRQGEQTIRFQAKLNTLTHSPEPLANIRIPDSENLLIPASR